MVDAILFTNLIEKVTQPRAPPSLLTPLILLLFITLPSEPDGLRVGTAVVDISPTRQPTSCAGQIDTVRSPRMQSVAFENGKGAIPVMPAWTCRQFADSASEADCRR